MPRNHIISAMASEIDSLASYWIERGNNLFRLGNYDEAIKAYEKAINIDPKNAESWNSMGLALCYLEKHK